MIKIIEFDKYNRAEILEVYKTGDVRTNVFFETEDGVITEQDSNIAFFANELPFELTEEELVELGVKIEGDE